MTVEVSDSHGINIKTKKKLFLNQILIEGAPWFQRMLNEGNIISYTPKPLKGVLT